MRRGLLPLTLLLAAFAAGGSARAEETTFAAWTPETFARAKREGRILLVTVTTTWCHWCHVMQRETYGDPRVRGVLAQAFLPVRVDGDERPDLAERFREYRWPATAFLTPDARPVLALRGYRSPDDFLAILSDVRARVARGGPFPGFDAPATRSAAPAHDRAGLVALRERLVAVFDARWDAAEGGWGRPQKYPLAEPIEWGLLVGRLGGDGSGEAEARALRTLEQETRLLDPVWGGMYQYSVGGTWASPHFEKIVTVNAGALDGFADAHLRTKDERWARAAGEVLRFLREFLRAPDGSFFASQDAEPPGGQPGESYFRLGDGERRRRGLPRVDRHSFPRENGLVVQALCRLHAATGDASALADAVAAAEAVRRSHGTEEGSFVHDPAKAGVRYLVDQAEMGRAFFALHARTGEKRWLDAAVAVAKAADRDLRAEGRGGYYDHTKDPVEAGVFGERLTSFEPNATMARLLLDLHRLTDDDSWRERALGAIAAIADPEAVERVGRASGGLLLAVEEALVPAVRVEVAGAREDPAARALFEAARLLASRRPQVRVLWNEPERPGPAHALVCGLSTCSDPVTLPAGIDAAVTALLRKR